MACISWKTAPEEIVCVGGGTCDSRDAACPLLRVAAGGTPSVARGLFLIYAGRSATITLSRLRSGIVLLSRIGGSSEISRFGSWYHLFQRSQ